jgi:hypothetical protein
MEPAIKVARMINNHLDNILTCFTHGIGRFQAKCPF